MTLSKRKRLVMVWSVSTGLVVLGIAAIVLLIGKSFDPFAIGADGRIEGLTDTLQRELTDDMVRFSFTEVTDIAGIDFHHFPATRQSLLPEDMGSGLAWGDYNNNGLPDLFLVNFKGPIADETDNLGGRCALYRNNGDGTFTDVSAIAGVDLAIHGMGAVWGDYNNNGLLDLYVTAYGANVLLKNNGDGTFTDVTEVADVGDAAFSAGASWFDYNNNGWLDLYVTNYVDFELPTRDLPAVPQYGTEVPFTLNPSSYRPAPNRLYRNNGDGTFTDISEQAGVADPNGRSLQSVAFDFDLDGHLDLYVANDISANGVFRNLGEGEFADIGASSLAADYRGAMGMAVGDYNRNGLFDLFITHWVAQENALFENMTLLEADDPLDRRVLFMEVSEMQGLGFSSLRMVGWATGFADFDNDGRADLWVVNGHTLQQRDDPTRLIPQPLQLYRQTGDRGFVDIASHAWPDMAPIVGRGGAHADFNGNGRIDLAINVHGGRAILLKNTTEDAGNWVAFRLRQIGLNTRAIGARVTVRTGAVSQTEQLLAGSSYLSQNSELLHFGLCEAKVIDEVIIDWPDGHRERLLDVAAGRVIEREHQPAY